MSKLLIDNLKNAEIIKKPFKHTLFKLFDLETNNKLVKNFIEIMQEKKLKNKGKLSKSRFMIILKGDNLNGINYKEGKYDRRLYRSKKYVVLFLIFFFLKILSINFSI